jgi:hypothetical protein
MHKLPDIDVFDLWRWLLSLVVTIYVAVYTWRTFWGYVLWFNSSRRYQVMGRYAVVLLLRARTRRFAGEMVRIGLLCALLAGIVGLHWVLL